MHDLAESQGSLSCTISEAGLPDLGEVSSLARRIWPVCFAGVLTPDQISNILDGIYNEENLKDEMAKGHRFWMAYDSAEPIGYVSAYKEGQTIWLKKLYILPQCQGSGVGSALLRTATDVFLPAREQRLLVNRDNTPAQEYYVHKGFACVDEIPVRMGDFRFVDLVFSRVL